jgi:hypothetical protein
MATIAMLPLLVSHRQLFKNKNKNNGIAIIIIALPLWRW